MISNWGQARGLPHAAATPLLYAPAIEAGARSADDGGRLGG